MTMNTSEANILILEYFSRLEPKLEQNSTYTKLETIHRNELQNFVNIIVISTGV